MVATRALFSFLSDQLSLEKPLGGAIDRLAGRDAHLGCGSTVFETGISAGAQRRKRRLPSWEVPKTAMDLFKED